MASAQGTRIATPAEIERIELRYKDKGAAFKSTIEESVLKLDVDPITVPKGADKFKFKLSDVIIFNSKVYSDEQLQELYASKIGPDASLKDMYDIVSAINKKYSDDGYYRSQAIIAEQEHDVDDVTFFIGIQEVHIDRVTIIEKDSKEKVSSIEPGEVKVIGNIGGKRSIFTGVAKKVIALSKSNNVPLRKNDVVRYEEILRELPGTKITKFLANPHDDTAINATHLIIEVGRAPKIVDARVSYDNRGTETVGPGQVSGSLIFDSLFGLSQKINLSVVTTRETKELKYAALSLTEYINSAGTTLTYSGNKSKSEPGDTLESLEVKSDSITLAVEAEHPVSRIITQPGNQKHSVDISGGFTYKNSRTDQLGEKTSEDRLRILHAELQYQTDGNNSGGYKTSVKASVHHGVPILNGTQNGDDLKTRDDGKADFTRVSASAYLSGFLESISKDKNVEFVAQASGQWSADSLLSSQEFGVGGETFGRAYDSSEITGDHGWAGSLELRYHLFRYREKAGSKPSNCSKEIERAKNDYVNHFLVNRFSDVVCVIQSASIYAFYDFGSVYEITPVNEPRWESLASAGGGLRFSIFDTLDGALEFTKPLTRPINDKNDMRFFFRLTTRL